MRRLIPPALSLLALSAFTTAAQADLPADPPTPAACSIEARTYNSRTIACSVTPTDEARRFVFKANFSGGHDDTDASIEPVLDSQALSCDAGSKIRLFGEDGDVSVWCAFQAADPKAKSTLKVEIRWSHAEYTNFEFVRQ